METRKLLLLSLASLAVLATASAQVQQTWIQSYGSGNGGGDLPTAMVVDTAGNVHVTGRSWATPNPTGSDYDYATVKYSSAGVELWASRYDGIGYATNRLDSPTGIALDNSGNVFVTGVSDSTSGGRAYATVKYDPAGNELWAARYGGSATTVGIASAICIDAAGNAIVTGGATTQLPNGTTIWECATVKYDSVGNLLWTARYSGPSGLGAWGAAMAVDSAANVFVTGRIDGPSPAFATLMYDQWGTEQWAALYSTGFGGYAQPSAMAIASNGNIVVTGASTGADGTPDYATVAHDTNGTLMWVSRLSGPGHGEDWPAAISADDSGNVVVTGRSIGTQWGSFDYATIKYNSSGVEQWGRRLTTANDDRATAVQVDAAGGVFVTGYSGPWDALVWSTIKYDENGNTKWHVPSANLVQFSPVMALGPGGAVVLSGPSANDYFTIRYDPICVPPVTYCTAKVNSLGCLPQISSLGNSSASSQSGFVVSCERARNNKPGLLLYGSTGRSATAFQGGWLCIAGPVRRAAPASAGGSPAPANDCTGAYSVDMNALASGAFGGTPSPALRTVGTIVDCQWWSRDVGATFNTSLSNAIEYTVCP
jgi:hypothetical protein